MPRKHLSHCIKAQHDEEKVQKKVLHQPNKACLLDDVAINIEDATASQEVGKTATAPIALLQEEGDKLPYPSAEADEQELSDGVVTMPKLQSIRKQEQQRENVELKVSQ